MSSSPKVSYLPGYQREKTIKKKGRTFRPGSRLLTVIAVFLLLYLLVSFVAHFNRLYALQSDISQIEQEVNDLKAKNEDLRKELKQVQSDAYVEQVAREKLGLVKSGETMIVPVQKESQKNN
ncbi:MAG: FtsB family cell division protein [Bacillota bacterium]